MGKFKAFLGYFWAALMVPLVMITLMGMNPIAEAIVDITGVQISPWFTGGEVARTIPHNGYETRIHRPVFDALIGQRSEGFVQVVWAKAEALPETLTEVIDYDNDGQADFEVTLHPRTKTAEWKPLAGNALALEGVYTIGDGVGVRITLKNKK